MTPSRLASVLACASTLVCAGCARPPAADGARQHVVLGVSALRISQPVFVAIERGLFKARGLDVELKKFDTAQPLADELAAERIDAGGYAALPILFGREGAAPKIRVLSAIVEDEQHRISYLLVRKGSGLRGVAALRGKRIGILPTVAYRRWIEAVLAADGMAPTDVTITPIAPQLQADSLAGGGVEALFTGDPMATAALARGIAEPATDTPDVPRVLGSPFLFGTFAVTASLATRRPAVARAIRDALDEAIGLLAADPDLGRAAMTPYLRAGERAFVSRYPATRYLRSSEVAPAALDKALGQAGATVHAADVAFE